MSAINAKGFNSWQDEILALDHNLNEEVDPSDEHIALRVDGISPGSPIPWNHPRFKELREEYVAFLKAEDEALLSPEPED